MVSSTAINVTARVSQKTKKKIVINSEGVGWLTITTMKEFDRANAIIEAITKGIKN